MQMLTAASKGSIPDRRVPVVEELGRRQYGVADAHYDTVGTAVDAERPGAPFTPVKAWATVYGDLSSTMRTLLPNGWRPLRRLR